MSAILLFAAKRALIDFLTTELGPEVQVSYMFPAAPERLIVHAGAARFTRSQALAEWAQAVEETVVVDIWLRVQELGGDLRVADQKCEDLAGLVIGALSSPRGIGAGLTFSDVTSGTNPQPVAAPNPEPTITSTLVLQVSVRGVQV